MLTQRSLRILSVLFLLAPVRPLLAGQPVVPTAEGQIGETPAPEDRLGGPRFESIRGQPGDVVFGGLRVFGGAAPPPPEFEFLTDRIHGVPNAVPITSTAVTFTPVAEQPPSSGWSRDAAGLDDFVAFATAYNGSVANTMTVGVNTFDSQGTPLAPLLIPNVGTAPVPDPGFSSTAVGVDDQGRVSTVFTELLPSQASSIRGIRFDANTGTVLDPSFEINGDGNQYDVAAALLDPAGNRLVVASVEIGATVEIKGNVVDFSAAVPTVGAEFQVNTTPAMFANFNPAVAAHRSSGIFTVVWENLSSVVGNPVDIFARRFDGNGNPLGDDFRVNTTTAESQGQPMVTYSPTGESAIVWAGDSTTPGDQLDVFAQVYDAAGNPLGGEIKVNTNGAGTQDRPAVRFLPEPDALGQPQFVVAWRDTANADGSGANGTGQSYKCFSIGTTPPIPIFADGFESGDTSSWSSTVP
jgi:hypothetical protein